MAALKSLIYCIVTNLTGVFYTITAFRGKVIPFLLADVGEGIAEMQIKEW